MRTDKSGFFEAERQEPYNAAEHAEARDHQDEFARDVPRTCICFYLWNVQAKRYDRIGQDDGGQDDGGRPGSCPWHNAQEGDSGGI